MLMPSHSHRVTFGYIKFHLPVLSWRGLLARSNSSEVNVYTLHSRLRTEDLISGRSSLKVRNRIGPKTDPWGTPDSTGIESEAWSSNTTC